MTASASRPEPGAGAGAIRPFRGLRYATERGLDLGRLTAPPYDVIDDERARELAELHPANVVHLDWTGSLPDVSGYGTNPYQRSRDLLDRWLSVGDVCRDPEPGFYVHDLTFTDVAGAERRRRGVLAIARLAELGDGVYPHEETHAGPIADRLDLLRHTRVNLSPVFAIVAGALPELPDPPGDALGRWRDAVGTRHQLRRVVDPAWVEAWGAAAQAAPLVIADGHHRYRSALAYTTEQRQAGRASGTDDHILVYLTGVGDSGLVVEPIHRLFASLNDQDADLLRQVVEARFERRPVASVEAAQAALGSAEWDCALALTSGTELLRLKERPESPPLATDLVRVHLIEEALGWRIDQALGEDRLAYESDWRQVERGLAEGRYGWAALVPAVPPATVVRYALEGRCMPPKTTYFTPKVPTGLVFHVFD